MDFDVFQNLTAKFDQATLIFTKNIIQKSFVLLTPVIIVGLTLSFIIYGLLIIRGLAESPVTEFLNKAFRIGIIVSFVLMGGFYQSRIVEAIQCLPDEVAVALISDTSADQPQGAASLIDRAAGKGFDQVGKAFELGGFFSSSGLTYIFFGIIILMTTAVLVAIGGAYLLVAKVGLSLLAALGPFFVASLLFEPTKHFFEKWVTQIINYTLSIILFAAIFGFMMEIFSSYIDGVEFEKGINVGYSLGGAVILSVAMIVILKQLPSLASALAGGISLSYMSELKSVKQGIATVYRGLKAGSRAVSSGVQKTHGYFKGKQTQSSRPTQQDNRSQVGYSQGKQRFSPSPYQNNASKSFSKEPSQLKGPKP